MMALVHKQNVQNWRIYNDIIYQMSYRKVHITNFKTDGDFSHFSRERERAAVGEPWKARRSIESENIQTERDRDRERERDGRSTPGKRSNLSRTHTRASERTNAKDQ